MRLILEVEFASEKKNMVINALASFLNAIGVTVVALLEAPDDVVPETSIVDDWANAAKTVNEHILGDKKNGS